MCRTGFFNKIIYVLDSCSANVKCKTFFLVTAHGVRRCLLLKIQMQGKKITETQRAVKCK